MFTYMTFQTKKIKLHLNLNKMARDFIQETMLLLKKVGFSETETNGILGNNWYNFYKDI